MEIVIVLIIALVVFGPKRLPELGKSAGKGLREFKGSLTDSRAAIEGPADVDDAAEPSTVKTSQNT